MAQEMLSLTPELLLSQAQEMNGLKRQYEQLFQRISATLRTTNSGWSEYLANSFSGKIESARRGFSNVELMLANGAAAAMLGANNLGERDAILGRQIATAVQTAGTAGGFSADMLGTLGTLGAQAGFTRGFWDEKKQDYEEVMDGVAAFDDYLGENLTDEQKKLINDLIKTADMKDAKKLYDIITMIAHGEYGEASQTLGKDGLDAYFKKYYGEAGSLLSEYTFHFVDGTASALAKTFIEDPSWENIANVGWNATVQPVVETAGNVTWNVLEEYFPHISQWYKEQGATDGGSAAQVALGELYGIFGGEEAKEYARNYYTEHGGLFGGISDGMKDMWENAAEYYRERGLVQGAVDGLTEVGSWLKERVGSLNWMSQLRI